MSHIKGYVQFISEQNQGQAKLDGDIAVTRRLIQLAKDRGLKELEDLNQKRLDKLLQTKKYNMTQEKETAPKVAPAQNGVKSDAEPAANPDVSLAAKFGSGNPGAVWTDEQKAAREQLAVDTTAAPHDASMRMSSAKDNAKFKVGEKGKPVATPAVAEPIELLPEPAAIAAITNANTDTKPAAKPAATPAATAAKKQEPFQMSSGRGNEALRARNMAKAKARKQNPTVNTKPTLNKAGTDSGSGVDALRQRINKRSEERGK